MSYCPTHGIFSTTNGQCPRCDSHAQLVESSYPDQAIYVRFTVNDAGHTRMVATQGYSGPEIARLEFARRLHNREEHELDHAVRLGSVRRKQ